MYRRMGQGLRGASYIYCQFTDMVFGQMPATQSAPVRSTFIGDQGDYAFSPFVDDHNGAAKDFKSIFKMLHEEYFPRVI